MKYTKSRSVLQYLDTLVAGGMLKKRVASLVIRPVFNKWCQNVCYISVLIYCLRKKKNSIILVALIAHHTPKVTLFALQPHAGLCRRVPVILRCHASNEMTPSFISKLKERELDSSKINTLNITSSYGSALHHELRRWICETLSSYTHRMKKSSYNSWRRRTNRRLLSKLEGLRPWDVYILSSTAPSCSSVTTRLLPSSPDV